MSTENKISKINLSVLTNSKHSLSNFKYKDRNKDNEQRFYNFLAEFNNSFYYRRNNMPNDRMLRIDEYNLQHYMCNCENLSGKIPGPNDNPRLFKPITAKGNASINSMVTNVYDIMFFEQKMLISTANGVFCCNELNYDKDFKFDGYVKYTGPNEKITKLYSIKGKYYGLGDGGLYNIDTSKNTITKVDLPEVPPKGFELMIEAPNGNILLFGSDNGDSNGYAKSYYSTDNGSTWKETIGLDVETITACTIGKTVIVGTSYGIMKSEDGGVNWTSVNGFNNYDKMNCTNVYTIGNIVLASVAKNGIYKSTDNGNNWKKVSNYLRSGYNHVFRCLPNHNSSDPGSKIIHAFVKGNNNLNNLYSTDYGESWTNPGGAVNNGDESLYSDKEIFAVGHSLITYGQLENNPNGSYNYAIFINNGNGWNILQQNLPKINCMHVYTCFSEIIDNDACYMDPSQVYVLIGTDKSSGLQTNSWLNVLDLSGLFKFSDTINTGLISLFDSLYGKHLKYNPIFTDALLKYLGYDNNINPNVVPPTINNTSPKYYFNANEYISKNNTKESVIKWDNSIISNLYNSNKLLKYNNGPYFEYGTYYDITPDYVKVYDN